MTCLPWRATIHAEALHRRDMLRAVTFAGAASALSPWSRLLSADPTSLKKRSKSCIILWMQGAPSQFETFSPKADHANGGETKAIATSAPGVQIAENLPELAKVMQHWCVLRSLTSKEGSHPRGTYLLHTGYLPTASVKYPTLGSTISHEIGNQALEIPNFVRVGQQRLGDNAGFLGTQHDPFLMQAAERMPENTAIPTDRDRYERRLGLLHKLEDDYASRGGKQEVENHRKLYERTAKMIPSPQLSHFDLSKESPAAKTLYGESPFGQACLLARRLVEHGVSCVEVVHGNWDTHDDNFKRCRQLCEDIDRPMAALTTDLHQRGLLQDTLVAWLGEFGRTPRINGRSGRDHHPKAFCGALAGGGVRGGQVIGATSAGGEEITERPVSVPDLFRTLCHGLGIDANKEHMSNIGRPIKIVDGGELVKGIF